ncbi:VOC family protein [Novosphingobium cyanobacteriorum]|uniref:VOC family protein n=1 Tax=Novosphingobium cyanobacteriorum TaxID=3024215 RepID=A0ABT6CE19_9SPHN|nr:VOC family protein [Novosphingobium cyanobacteriorum]MDF8332173.1 VOC family protein [Novosphingobium cyanobacteriorum]
MALLPPSRLEHFGINVVDLDAMERFYVDTFGFTVSDRGTRFNGNRIVFLTKSPSDHHQFVLTEGRRDAAGENPINQISFNVGSLDNLRLCFERLSAEGHDDFMQINHGNAWSIYTHDPEGNPIELFADSDWHTPQPCRGDLDLTKPVQVILQETEDLCSSRAGSSTRNEWIARMQQAIPAGGDA